MTDTELLKLYNDFIEEYKCREKGWMAMIESEPCSCYPNNIKEKNIQLLEEELKRIRWNLTRTTTLKKKLKENE